MATLSEYYTGKGQKLPSISERAKLYESYGFGSAGSYVGSASQNTALLGKLSSGDGATATPTANPTQPTPTFQNTDQVTAYLNSAQNGGGGFDANALAKVLVEKGGYNEVDAANAAKGERAAALAKEFGLTSDTTSSSLPTFDQLKSSLAPTSQLPDPINRVQTRQDLREQYGLDSLEGQLTDLKAQEQEIIAERRLRTNNEQGKPVALGVIGGRVSEIERQESERLDAVTRQKAVVIDELNTKYSVINTFIQDLGLDYQDAVQRYNTEFDQNLKVYDLLRGLQSDLREEEKLKLQKQDVAKANLQVYVNAITQGNLDPNSLSADQKATINKMELQAGLPVGFVSNLKMSPKDQIMFTNSADGVTQVGFYNSETGQIDVKSYGTKTSGSVTGKIGSDQYKATAQSEMFSYLSSVANSYGDVDPATWQRARASWQSKGLDVETFNKQFSNFADQNRGDYEEAYGLKL